jgi:threonine aldolase
MNRPMAMTAGRNASTDMLRELFDIDCDVYFVFNGTAANSLALASLCQSYHSVICTPVAHIETDECGGPEFFSNGSKLLVAESHFRAAARLGKLTPEAVEALVTKRSDIHYPRPKVVSITQATELGTVYSVEEVRAIAWPSAKKHHLRLHMDGARFANAVAHLGCHPGDITWRAGVDVLCFGGTKNGLPVGEAVVFFDKSAERRLCLARQTGRATGQQNALHLRPLGGLLENDAWLANARHANAMAAAPARRAWQAMHGGAGFLHPPQANWRVRRASRRALSAALRDKGWKFYDVHRRGGCRFMCAWDTQEEVQAGRRSARLDRSGRR